MSTALSNLALTLAIILLIRIFYTTLYRLVLSPLAKVPGPKLAALTSWYECYYDAFKPGQYVFKIKELHEQYGMLRNSKASFNYPLGLQFPV